ncbi:class I SAM-dependent methyltransferase [Halopiger goleimassiliensis]|uniref:class I SAM-dependent methyltransferase n=1 Tax=Halopiger goleimassiliensis TaxID=1293048 RepID=UPI000677B449|nr:class I SAM-dependent methyltransferase [Halopiger goleimassiliensis]
MAGSPFETKVEEYEAWFDAHRGAYRAEQTALEHAVPDDLDRSDGLAIGVGTGRFAGPLDLSVGVDPAAGALERAADRGVDPVRGVAESLPVADDAVSLVALVTVLSFVDDVEATLAEARRVLADDGALVVAVLDRSSPVGRIYQESKDEDPFYAHAEFLTAAEACEALEAAGFAIEQRLQTIFDDPAELEAKAMRSADVREGHGDGLFAVIQAIPDGN